MKSKPIERTVLAAFVVMTTCGSRPAWTTEIAHPRLSQLAHRAWRTGDGTLPLPPQAIEAAPDGYLWIGTDAGLLRFDGVRFVLSEAFPREQVFAVRADRDGSLWAGTKVGLFHLGANGAQLMPPKQRINRIARADDGRLWLAASRHADMAGVCWVESGATIACRGTPGDNGSAVAADGNDAWTIVADGARLCHDNATADTCMTPRDLQPAFDGALFEAVAASPDGILVALKKDGEAAHLVRVRGRASDDLGALPGAAATTEVSILQMDAERTALWIGTTDRGVYRWTGGMFENAGSRDGLSADAVLDIAVDHERTVWVVTTLGIDQFYRRPIETWSMREGLTADSVSSVAIGADGRVYLGNEGGLDIIDGDAVRSVRGGQGLPGHTIQGMYVDRDGLLWLGVDSTLWTFRDGMFRASQLPRWNGGAFVWMAQDAGGTYYIGSQEMEFRWRPGQLSAIRTWDAYPATSDYAPDPVAGMWRVARGRPPAHLVDEAITVAGDAPPADVAVYPSLLAHAGHLWSTTAAGLRVWKDGHYRMLGRDNGVDFRIPDAAIFDADGNLWVMMERGYLRLDAAELAAWLGDGTTRLHPREFGFADGARPGLSTFAANAQLAPNGDLWFATDKFAQRIRPRAMALGERPPAVVVEDVVVDGVRHPASGVLALAPHPHTVQVDFTAFTFVNPSDVRFRYRLDGIDDDWRDAQGPRQATYTDLPPGRFAFRVLAANCDGVWNEAGARFEFSVQPTFWQTTAFRALVALVMVALLVAFHRMRQERLMRSTRVRLFERVAERERIARDLHDTFFQGIQGLLLRFQTGVSSMRRDDPARAQLLEALDQSDRVMLEGRELVLDLRERLDGDRPLHDVLAAVGEDLAELYATRFALAVEGAPRPLRAEARDELFRIGKEAIVNAFRHAEANRIDARVRYRTEALSIQVDDDGKGLDDAVAARGRRPGHWGLPGMRERAARIGASIDVASEPGRGTRFAVRLPSSLAYAKR